MSISMALFSPPISSSLQNPNLIPKIPLSLLSTKRFSLVSVTRATSDNGTTSLAAATTVEILKPASVAVEEILVKSPAETSSASENGAVAGEKADSTTATVIKFEIPKWVNGTWDMKQFEKDGKINWDSIIVSD